MDSLNESENNAKISDSAYSNSCSNSQSRRSHSSTHSGSHSSRSSGYGGKQSVSSSNHLSQPAKKWSKDKDGKKKKPVQKDPVQLQAAVEFRLPKPAMACQIKEEVSDIPVSPNLDQVEIGVDDESKNADKKDGDDMVCTTPQSPIKIVMSKPSCSDGFSCVISMDDGVVIYSTASLTATLGFPKDMWIGRSFIDFIHPLDHNTFASQITSGLATPKKVNFNTVQSSGNVVSTMFCRIRRYRGLANGFAVKDRTVTFMPFMLKLSFRNINDGQGVLIYLVIQATALFSAFKTAHEIVTNPVPFVMRHISNGNLEYIDHEAVPMLGYLPQDVTGKDVLRLYHPEDLVYMRQIYETIVKEGGASRSKSYRLMAQNGHYLKLETEWSSFINPWSRKLEFVIGKHHVIEGPADPDVFQPPIEEITTTEAKNKAQGLRDSIVRIMNEVLTKPAEFAKQQMTKRCQDLASLMENLMEEPSKMEEELRLEMPENENSYFERDSVMLGGISPHHDYNDSKSSTTTPLSYNQLNFNDNLQRYFNSHQQISYEEYQEIRESVTPKDPNTSSGDCMSPIAQLSGDSTELTSSSESTGAAVGDNSTKLPRLTESLLCKHNSEMEKSLLMQYRECRPSNKESREKASIDKQKKKGHLARCNATYLPTIESTTVANPQPNSLKRASTPLEPDTRANKQHCAAPRVSRRRTTPAPVPTRPLSHAATVVTSQWQQTSTSINPYISNLGMSQQLSIMSSITPVPGLIPMYCVPTTGPAIPSTSEMSTEVKTTPHFPVPHLQYMMYGQAMFGSPYVMSPINPHVTYPIQQHNPTTTYSYTQDSLGLTTSNYEEACKPGLLLAKPGNPLGINFWREKKRTKESLNTSSKVDQGSGNSSSIGSMSNTLNRSTDAVPESSNSRHSKIKGNRMVNSEEAVDRTDEESSYSSFYSSFFKTESGSAEDGGDTKKGQNGTNLGGKDGLDNTRDKIMRRKREPPWMEHVSVTSELVYKYQLSTKSINDALSADKKKIVSLQQPSMVNDQLDQLYMDMELEGEAARLTLEEGVTSSGSSGEENALITKDITSKRLRRKREYSKLVMIYEEDAPFPPPCETGSEIESTDPATPLT